MSGFTDYHAHFVYGVDDGARTREEMFAMLDAAAADGVTRLFATSHSTPGMEPFPRDVYQRHLDFARAYCAEKGYDLMLESGSELLYTPAAAYAAAEHSLITLGSTDWVLLEFVPDVAAAEKLGCVIKLIAWMKQGGGGSGNGPAADHRQRLPGAAGAHRALPPPCPQRCAAPPEGTVRHPLSGQCGHGAGGRILSAPEAGPLAEGRPCGRDLLGRT
jgi:hypothetical protein